MQHFHTQVVLLEEREICGKISVLKLKYCIGTNVTHCSKGVGLGLPLSFQIKNRKKTETQRTIVFHLSASEGEYISWFTVNLYSNVATVYLGRWWGVVGTRWSAVWRSAEGAELSIIQGSVALWLPPDLVLN